MKQSIEIKKPFFSATIIAFVVFLSKITAMARDILFAKYLGTGIIAEAFYSAYRLPNTFRRIFAEGAVSNVFVPFFSVKIKDKKQNALIFAGRVLMLLSITMIILTIVIEIFMPQIIGLINPGFIKNKEKFELTVQFARITFPYLICISICALFGAILNSIGSFWQFTSVSMILNITFIIGLLINKNFFQNIGFYLCFLLILAGFIQIIFISFFCIKKCIFPKFLSSNQTEVEKKQNKLDIKSFLIKLLPAICSSGILQINIFVDGIFASFFPGLISRMYYADRIGQFTLSLIGYSLSVAILPTLSIAFAKKNIEQIKQIQTKSINIALFFTIPAVCLLETVSLQIISLVYQRGAFSSNDSQIVANMLSIYAICLPFSILLKILFVFFYSKKDTSTPLKIGIFSLISNIILNIILIRLIGQYCVLTATTISSILTFLLTILILIKNNSCFINIKNLNISLKILIISVISCVIVPIILRETISIILLLLIIATIHILLCILFKLYKLL